MNETNASTPCLWEHICFDTQSETRCQILSILVDELVCDDIVETPQISAIIIRRLSAKPTHFIKQIAVIV